MESVAHADGVRRLVSLSRASSTAQRWSKVVMHTSSPGPVWLLRVNVAEFGVPLHWQMVQLTRVQRTSPYLCHQCTTHMGSVGCELAMC
jgi:hypothetical protein